MKKIFRKDLYIKDMLNYIIENKDYEFLSVLVAVIGPKGWTTECDGKEVTDEHIGKRIILDDWCEVVEDES